jgi:hypothetical protein
MQVAKLQALPLDEQARHILALIQAQQFQDVIQLIEQWRDGVSRPVNEFTDTQVDLERFTG